MIKVANNLNTLCAKRASKARDMETKDLLDMDSWDGALADYWGPVSYNPALESRAGRATAMAEAIGEDPSFFVTNPRTSNLLMSLPFTLGGGLLGYLAGNSIGSNLPDAAINAGEEIGRPLSLDRIGGSAGGIIGGVAGAAGGSLLGNVINNAIRRSKMRGIAERFDAANKKTPVDFEPSTPLLFLGGTHDLGRVQANRAMRGEIDPDEASDYGAKPYVGFGGDLVGSLFTGLPLGDFGTRGYDKLEARRLVKERKKNTSDKKD